MQKCQCKIRGPNPSSRPQVKSHLCLSQLSFMIFPANVDIRGERSSSPGWNLLSVFRYTLYLCFYLLYPALTLFACLFHNQVSTKGTPSVASFLSVRFHYKPLYQSFLNTLHPFTDNSVDIWKTFFCFFNHLSTIYDF